MYQTQHLKELFDFKIQSSGFYVPKRLTQNLNRLTLKFKAVVSMYQRD